MKDKYQKNKKKINLLVDYPISKNNYTGLTFPYYIYKYLLKDKRFNTFSSNDNHPNSFDAILIFSAGSHFSIRDSKITELGKFDLLSLIFNKARGLVYFLSFIIPLRKIGYYKRLYFPHNSYLNKIKSLKKKYPSAKIIHRLDGSYQFICKNYGFDKTVSDLNKIADLTIHQSKFSEEIWSGRFNNLFNQKEILRPKKHLLIPNGVDLTLFKSGNDKFRLKGKWKILHVSASSNPNKGLVNVLEMAEIFSNNSQFQFYLIGGQIDDPLCGNDIKHFKNVHYLGKIKNRKKIAKYFRSMNIFFYPSRNDCSPNVILEALASGLPVITLDSGGNKELIYKEKIKAGCIFNDKNPALSFKTIIDNYRNYRSNAFEIAKKYHDINSNLKIYADQINLLSREK